MSSIRYRYFLLLLLLLNLAIAWPAAGDISLPKYFSDHMVLQRNRTLTIRGKAEPNEKLVVSFADQMVSAVADQAGKWSANINTGPAGGPYSLEVASKTNETKVLFSNVMIGEVWICGGEANLAVPVADTEFAQADIAAAKNFPQIRMFKIGQIASSQELPDFTKVDPWYCCSSDTVGDFSAVGFFYARELSAKLNIPIGMIQLTEDAVPLESWLPQADLKKSGFDKLLEHWSDQNEPSNPNAASALFNGMVAPMVQTPIGGVIWYHGTANIERGQQYARMLPLLVSSWREHFKCPQLPFFLVQPEPFRFDDLASDALPEIWDAQLRVFKKNTNIGLVTTMDLTAPTLVHNRHKLSLAKRLAKWSFSACYKLPTETAPKITEPASENIATDSNDGAQEPSAEPGGPSADADDPQRPKPSATEPANPPMFSGPVFDSFEKSGKQVIISFRYADGLKIETDTENNGFTICGPDKKYLPASLKLDGSKIVAYHREIDEPVSVRYGWSDMAQPALTNSSGLPASPFRTDDFPLPSNGIEF